jgi:OOP family OmpA-OmpF porin
MSTARLYFTVWLGLLCAAGGFLGAGCNGGTQAPVQAPPAGVPDVDNDHVPDDVDECVTQQEDHKPPKPDDGCAVDPNDLDGDGIGVRDKCPNELETRNGYEDEDGCPDELPKDTKTAVVVTRDELKCCAKILFATGAAAIDSASDPILGHIAATFKDNPEIKLVEVAGHADSRGTAQDNLTLTSQRAAAVVEALAGLGVERARLRAVGYGSYCPAVEGDTPEAREVNRRVDFKIVRRGDADTGAELGCAAAKAKGIGGGGPAPKAAPPAVPKSDSST